MSGPRDWAAALFGVAALLALSRPVARSDDTLVAWTDRPALLACLAMAVGVAAWRQRQTAGRDATALTAAAVLGAFPPVAISGLVAEGFTVDGAIWGYVAAHALLVWRALSALAGLGGEGAGSGRLAGLLVPAAFGAWLLYLWQVFVVGFAVPAVLLPAPGAIGSAIAASTATLAADFHQTFVRSVLPGYAIGCASGFAVAVLVDRIPFLQRGLLPLGNLVSALPIVGIAPIMVMWFGFDWQSKAAVVTVMTFFPMLVNSISGLNCVGRIERDLMRSYGAGYLRTLVSLRIPSALPFVFNALKINSTLALIGAIVAEFFGTPIVGMGFRISTEIGRMNVEMVWATIAVAAVSGSLFYGALTVLERGLTHWHPSYRG